MKKQGLRLACLCLMAALGLIALNAVFAQAEKGAKWTLVNKGGKLVEVTETLLPTLKAELENSVACLLFKIGGASDKSYARV